MVEKRRITSRFTPPPAAEGATPFFDTSLGRTVARRMPSNVGREVADLYGIERDLGFVERFADRLVALLAVPETNRDIDTITAFQDAALIRYRRCFANGVRFRLTLEAVKQVAPAGEEVHRHFFELANKNVAHSVNNKEILEPMLLVYEADGTKAGQGIYRMFGYQDTSDITALKSLAVDLRDGYVIPRRNILKKKFDQECQDMDATAVAKLKPLIIPVGGMATASDIKRNK
ncbi:hypothetical protein [uncultured Sphingomonas sp.]|uniref:hypothetical protein n=1 Tax=uncultured Sphingomonas sp. TaxID=158754 RepID=UPI0035CC455B